MTIKLITFGCRLNTYESEVIKTFLQNNTELNNYDIIIFNSCTVTSEAEKQLRQAIRKERRSNPHAIIGVVGCAVQTNTDTYKKMDEIDFIFGNIDKMQEKNYDLLIPIIKEKIKHHNNCNCQECHCHEEDENEEIETPPYISPISPLDFDDTNNNKAILVSNIFNPYILNPHPITGFEEKTRGFIQIQSGCNNHCTFCATRLARGKSTSIPSQQIISQINQLVSNGYNEIVLTGINITDYGAHSPENINLGKLLKKIIQETDLQRIRLSSLDIAGINDDLKDILFNESRMMPHIHLSLQSGDNTILQRMARRHTREQTISFCQEISKYKQNLAIGADLIAGFPTETDLMHQNTYNLIQEINLVFGHIFPYSIRENTPASLMPQVSVELRRQRAKSLRTLTTSQLQSFTQSQLNIPHQILIENSTTGRTENYLTINLPPHITTNHKIGDIITIISHEL